MYLMLVIFLCVLNHIGALRCSRGTLVPLARYVPSAAASSMHGLDSDVGSLLPSIKYATCVPEEVAKCMALRSWAYESFLERQDLYNHVLNRLTVASSLDELARAIEGATVRLGVELRLFLESPIVRVLLHREVYGFLSVFNSLLRNKYRMCVKDADSMLLEASPRLKLLNKARMEEVESEYLDFLALFGLSHQALQNVQSQSINGAIKQNTSYWYKVHLRAYRNGLKLVVKMAFLAMVNRCILPLFLQHIISLLAKYITFVDVTELFKLVSFNLQ